MMMAGSGRVSSLVTASGPRDVDAVVIATGTGTTRLAALAGVNVQTRACCNKASCGCSCTVRPVPGAAATHWVRSGHTPRRRVPAW